METDSQSLWQVFHHVYEDASNIDFVHKDCVTIASAFQSFPLCWIGRDANKIVYILARGALLRASYVDCTVCHSSIVRIVNAEKLSNLVVNEGS